MPEENQGLRKNKCFIWAQFGLSLCCLTSFFFVDNGPVHRLLTFLASASSDCSDDFFLFDSLRPVNNLSVKQGRVFMG